MIQSIFVILLATTTMTAVLSWTTVPRLPTQTPHRLALMMVSEKSTRSSSTLNLQQQRSAAATTSDGRRMFLTTVLTTALLLPSNNAHALVKGVAPPPPKAKVPGQSSNGDKPRCTNVEECQAMAELRDQELKEEEQRGLPPPEVTKGGTRYRDLQLGTDNSGDGRRIQEGDRVTLFFKTLKLGKRSYDGISGEGTVVFSRGYGLEDDETAPGTKSFTTTVGSSQNIAALNEALLNMQVGGIRRFAIVPQMGWEKPTKLCDGGPGGRGAGGELKTDYVVVPTATIVATESCLDTTKLPFPSTYAEQRRMAQRFDQSLIMEVQVVAIAR